MHSFYYALGPSDKADDNVRKQKISTGWEYAAENGSFVP